MQNSKPETQAFDIIRFVVLGKSAQKGSVTPMPRPGGSGFFVSHNDRNLKSFTERIRAEADKALFACLSMGGTWDDQCSMECLIVRRRKRPEKHFRSLKRERVLRADAPRFILEYRNDVDKLARAVLDALTGVCWRDDGQVVSLHVQKRWGLEEQTEIVVAQMRTLEKSVWVGEYAFDFSDVEAP